MATDISKVVGGGAEVSVSAYVTAGGAGSFVDVGHIKSPAILAVTREDFDIKSERAIGTLKKFPVDMKVTLKVSISEAVMENVRVAFGQPAANMTGTPPDLILEVGEHAEQYHQLKLVQKGVGTTGVRTLLLWRAIVESVAEVQFAKAGEQMYEITFDVLNDESVAAAGKFFKATDI